MELFIQESGGSRVTLGSQGKLVILDKQKTY